MALGIGHVRLEGHRMRRAGRTVLARIEQDARAGRRGVRRPCPGDRQRQRSLIHVIAIGDQIADACRDALTGGQTSKLQITVTEFDRTISIDAELSALIAPDPPELVT